MTGRAYILLAIFLWGLKAAAESPTSTADAIGQLQNGLASQGIDPNNLPAPSTNSGQPTPQPQPQQPPDRANKNGAAKGLAIAGAAMALLGCIQAMKMAQEATDPQTKAMYQYMATQQCSQGMKDMADAAKNDDAKKQLTMNDTPKQQQLPTNPVQPSQPEDKTPPLANNPTSPNPPADDTPLPTATPLPEKQKSKAQFYDGDEGTVNDAADIPTTALKVIPDQGLKFDENSRPGGATTPVGPSNGGIVYANGKAPDPAGAAKGVAADEPDRNGRRRKGTAEEGGESGEGGGESKSGGGAPDPFENMLSSIFGKPGDVANPFANGGGGGLSGGDFNNPQGGKDKKVNIFEYASYRYRQAAYKENRLKVKPARGIASVSKAAAN